jgi:diguanylate cyclase (GGDEF)-like protein
MLAIDIRRLFRRAVAVLLLSLLVAAAHCADISNDTAQLFARADSIKMIDNAGYQKLIEQLEARRATFSALDTWHLRYLEAWQTAYIGQDDIALPLLEAVAKQAPDADLREQATGTLINVLGINHRYQEAFTDLDQSLDELPSITRNSTRLHVLAEASQLLAEAGQYDLAITYADQMMLVPTPSSYSCLGRSIRLDAEYRKATHNDALIAQLQRGVDECLTGGQVLSADTLRTDIASIEIEQGHDDSAIALLQGSYAGMLKVQYQWLASQYDALLAQAYWNENDAKQAEKYATETIDTASKGNFVEPLSSAYQLLYQIARQKDDLRDALVYHEKFLVADNTRLDEMHEKALAYQVAKQQIEAKKAEMDALTKQNRILELQQALDHKAVETSRLYIALLLTVLASISFWLYRLKRSQLRFMHMAGRDDLTGLLNRQHFIEEAEQSLRYADKSMRYASLILIDLDHFKSINDTHGHIVGDQVLQRTVAVCQRHLHACDVFGRLGGEEFGILLPECSAENAIERAEQLRIAIQATPGGEAGHLAISASLGIASTTHHGHDLRHLLAAADEALYQAKRDGRNRVVINISTHSTASSTTDGYVVADHTPSASSDDESFNYAAEK